MRRPGGPTEKECAVCAAAFHQRADEPLTNWLRRETCSRRCGYSLRQSRYRTPATASAGQWHIVMATTGRRYIDRTYSEAEAREVLADLLRPYPDGHEWRAALCVRACVAGKVAA